MSYLDEIVTAEAEILANTGNAVRVTGWKWPGCGTVNSINITTGGGDINNWSLYETSSARLIENMYSVSHAMIPNTQRRFIPSSIMHGHQVQTIGESGVNLAACQGYVDALIKGKYGLTFMLHPGNLIGIPGGESGPYALTLADLTTFSLHNWPDLSKSCPHQECSTPTIRRTE
jgi:hypothetical protein